MATIIATSVGDMGAGPRGLDAGLDEPTTASAVSWGAIFAGAAGASALTLVLALLGTGLGLSAVSPWSNQGIDASTVGIGAIIWITLTQLLSAFAGGYLAGRLRAKWVAAHTHEVLFRDTAHGFLAWAVATLVVATLLTSAVTSVATGGVKAATSVVSGAANTTLTAGATAVGAKAGGDSSPGPMSDNGVTNYFVDTLFRSPSGNSNGNTNAAINSDGESGQSMEVARIFASAIRSGGLPADDAQYLSQLVAQRTGLSQEEARTRVNQTYERLQQATQKAEATAKEAAETARKASSRAALGLVISLIAGAALASWAATFAGRRRDLPDTAR